MCGAVNKSFVAGIVRFITNPFSWLSSEVQKKWLSLSIFDVSALMVKVMLSTFETCSSDCFVLQETTKVSAKIKKVNLIIFWYLSFLKALQSISLLVNGIHRITLLRSNLFYKITLHNLYFYIVPGRITTIKLRLRRTLVRQQCYSSSMACAIFFINNQSKLNSCLTPMRTVRVFIDDGH